jgi:hypothetical protein
LNSIDSVDDEALLKECFVTLVEKDRGENEKATRALGRLSKIPPKKLPHLMGALKTGVLFIVDSASMATWEGRTVFKALQVVMNDFGKLRFQEFMAAAVQPLMQALKFRDQDRRADAAEMLGRLGESAIRAVPDLATVLRQDDYIRSRKNAAKALGEIGKAIRLHDRDRSQIIQDQAVPALILALDDPAPWMRLEVIRAIGKIGTPAKDALSALQKIQSEEKDPEITKAASAAIDQLNH